MSTREERQQPYDKLLPRDLRPGHVVWVYAPAYTATGTSSWTWRRVTYVELDRGKRERGGGYSVPPRYKVRYERVPGTRYIAPRTRLDVTQASIADVAGGA